MSRLVQVEMPAGQVIWVHATTEGPSDVSSSKPIFQLAADDLSNTVNGIVESVRAGLKNMDPDQVSLEFGVEFFVKSGRLWSVLGEAGGSSSVKVTVTWDGGRRADAETPAP